MREKQAKGKIAYARRLGCIKTGRRRERERRKGKREREKEESEWRNSQVEGEIEREGGVRKREEQKRKLK